MNLEDLAFDSLKRMPPAEAYSSLFDQMDDLISEQAKFTAKYLENIKNRENDASGMTVIVKKIKMVRRLKKRLDKETKPTTPEDVRHLEI